MNRLICLVVIIVVANLLLSVSGGRITSDLRCSDDQICRFRSRDESSYCSFASGEYRDNKPVGWCQKGRSSNGPSRRNHNHVITVTNPPPIDVDPEPNTGSKTDVSKGRWNVRCTSDKICRANGFERCYFEYGKSEGYCEIFRDNLDNGGWTESYPTIPITTPRPISPPSGGNSKWDYTCGSDDDCRLRGWTTCSFASGEYRDGKPRGWCRPNKAAKPNSRYSATVDN